MMVHGIYSADVQVVFQVVHEPRCQIDMSAPLLGQSVNPIYHCM